MLGGLEFANGVALGADGSYVAVAETGTGRVGALLDRLTPRPESVVSALAVDDDGRIVHLLRGRIDGFRMLTGVRERGGRLWFGSLEGGVVATTAVPQSTGAVP